MIVPTDDWAFAQFAGYRRDLTPAPDALLPLPAPGHVDPLGRRFALNGDLGACSGPPATCSATPSARSRQTWTAGASAAR
jgi:hypothetical protein